jgi:tRNA pseudouridine55 synthase
MDAGRERLPWRRVDGLLLVDKAAGVTSNAALQAARRLYRAAKGGHTGTLDPLATGLLPVLFGEATKFGGELLDADKTYTAEIALGATTTTGDAEGEVVERRHVALGRVEIQRVLAGFRGELRQVPPMYSALKRHGRPLYEYARAGCSVERTARRIRIHELRLDAVAAERLAITVRCSKGTYVRVLAEDIGRALGCGAHLAQLRRVEIGPFSLSGTVTIEALEALGGEAREARLLPVDAVLGHLPAATLGQVAASRFMQGQPAELPGAGSGRIRVYGPAGTFVGIGEVGADGRLQPRRLISSGDAPAGTPAIAPRTL